MANSTIQLIKDNIKKYRKLRSLTQDALSEISGISSDYLSEIERGKKIPSIRCLDLIATALEVDTYKLLKSFA